ncbi:MAG: hypothetical protein QM690_00125 [Sphingobium sp.]
MMFTVHALLLFAHLLLFVYWLGSDVGVFYGIRFVLDPDKSLEARRTAMALVHWIDLLPRICLVLMVPVGLSLAVELGLLELSRGAAITLLTAAWLIGLGWLALVIRIYGGATGWLVSVDWVVRLSVATGFLCAGLVSFLGHGPVMEGANWLALKMIFFSCAIFCGIGLRILGRPFGAALGTILEGQGTSATEAALTDAMRQSKRIVLLLWTFVAATAYVGVTKAL